MHIIYISHAHINHQNASYAHLSKKEEYGDVILPDNPFHNSRSLDRLDISLTDQPTIEAFHILHLSISFVICSAVRTPPGPIYDVGSSVGFVTPCDLRNLALSRFAAIL